MGDPISELPVIDISKMVCGNCGAANCSAFKFSKTLAKIEYCVNCKPDEFYKDFDREALQ